MEKRAKVVEVDAI